MIPNAFGFEVHGQRVWGVHRLSHYNGCCCVDDAKFVVQRIVIVLVNTTVIVVVVVGGGCNSCCCCVSATGIHSRMGVAAFRSGRSVDLNGIVSVTTIVIGRRSSIFTFLVGRGSWPLTSRAMENNF